MQGVIISPGIETQPGPRQRIYGPRPPLPKVRGSRVVREGTRVSRSALLAELELWLQCEYNLDIKTIVSLGEESLNTILDRMESECTIPCPLALLNI